MKVFISTLIVVCLLLAGASFVRLDLQSLWPGSAVPAPAETTTQARPVDPNKLLAIVPPLESLVLRPEQPSVPVQVEERTPLPSLDQSAGVESNVTLGVERTVAPRLIDPADLEAAPDVLERRITNKAKLILEQIAAGPAVAVTTSTEDDDVGIGRGNRD